MIEIYMYSQQGQKDEQIEKIERQIARVSLNLICRWKKRQLGRIEKQIVGKDRKIDSQKGYKDEQLERIERQMVRKYRKIYRQKEQKMDSQKGW